ncbi:unnamed protein product [Rhizophagus irregularis]|nr:unnamed protein product [Rhizophagus irregularis]CAB4438679.1 unnamed protein product [Rhizophagus irregularis]
MFNNGAIPNYGSPLQIVNSPSLFNDCIPLYEVPRELLSFYVNEITYFFSLTPQKNLNTLRLRLFLLYSLMSYLNRFVPFS